MTRSGFLSVATCKIGHGNISSKQNFCRTKTSKIVWCTQVRAINTQAYLDRPKRCFFVITETLIIFLLNQRQRLIAYTLRALDLLE